MKSKGTEQHSALSVHSGFASDKGASSHFEHTNDLLMMVEKMDGIEQHYIGDLRVRGNRWEVQEGSKDANGGLVEKRLDFQKSMEERRRSKGVEGVNAEVAWSITRILVMSSNVE